ncbi:hypothetical protein CFBP4996_26625 (plasmid) [Agrobacterium leguminum]|uniref:hypothetical protein n=1 Tax=Agrobacterium leguminum TaxID=2792015 RepID=UPI0010CA1B88|nr:hypothetical protein [Agrobacterium leguminum]WFS69604.1 hypothetical protein CFBP4996_26625 [Agrobacterium leguminum]
MTEETEDPLVTLLTDIRDGLDRLAVAVESNTAQTARLAEMQARTYPHVLDLAGHSVYSKVHLAAIMELIKAISPKIDGAAIGRTLAAQVDKADRNEWIAALQGLEAMRDQLKDEAPYIRQRLEEEWKLNREGMKEDRKR